MPDPKETIQTQLAEIEHLQGRGEYAKCYERVKELLALFDKNPADRRTRCVVLVKAARSAYYMSKVTGEIMIMQVWESEEYFNAWNSSAEHAKILAQSGPLQILPPHRENYQLQTHVVANPQ